MQRFSTRRFTAPRYGLPQDLVEARDAALLSLDEWKIRRYMRRYRITAPSDPYEFWMGVHKARAQHRSLPMFARQESVEWLIARGHTAPGAEDVPIRCAADLAR
jgi:hypothetical protein